MSRWAKIPLTITAVTFVYVTVKGTVDLIIDRDFEHLVIWLPAIVLYGWLGVGIGVLAFGVDSVIAFPVTIVRALVKRKGKRTLKGVGSLFPEGGR